MRTLTQSTQTGLVWPTLAFEASVLDWSFHFDPPPKKMQHHIKIATSVDEPVVDLRLDIRADEGERLRIHWSAFGETFTNLDMPYDILLTKSPFFSQKISTRWSLAQRREMVQICPLPRCCSISQAGQGRNTMMIWIWS